jgi:anti-anti-sigma regulatory factor
VRNSTILDLGGLRFADSLGAGALRDLQAKGVTLQGASPFIRLLLGQRAPDDDP